MKKLIIFEQPLNEHMRACLRLEHLYSQLNLNISNPEPEASRTTIMALLEILNVVDRPDIKTKFTKVLSQISIHYSQLASLPQVDKEKLNDLLNDINSVRNQLVNLHGKLGQELHGNEFLTSIRMHMNNPGGACDFSLPGFKLWLEKPFENRFHDLQNWCQYIQLIENVTNKILKVTRDCKQLKSFVAEDGFFQQGLDPNANGELVRVRLPGDIYYPEISVGKHRMSIRFNMLNGDGRPKQTNDDIPFEMAYCCF